MADVSAWLAARATAAGQAVDGPLVAAAALLHDVDKLPGSGAPARLRHGEGSAAWLAARGWPELGPVVRDHPVTRLADAGYDAWAAGASLEARIVAYADKRAGQRLESMDERFASWRRRYPSGPGERVTERRGEGVTGRPGDPAGWDDDLAALVRARARALELDVCGAAAVQPGDVRRLRWSRRALRAARA